MFVVPKPLSRVLFMQALRMTRAARSRLTGLQSENRRLQKRIEDIRQQAMNQRRSKRDIAEDIIGGKTP